jgi:hypothetical protein
MYQAIDVRLTNYYLFIYDGQRLSKNKKAKNNDYFRRQASDEIKKGALFKALPFIEFVNRLICFIIKPYVMCAISYIMI